MFVETDQESVCQRRRVVKPGPLFTVFCGLQAEFTKNAARYNGRNDCFEILEIILRISEQWYVETSGCVQTRRLSRIDQVFNPQCSFFMQCRVIVSTSKALLWWLWRFILAFRSALSWIMTLIFFYFILTEVGLYCDLFRSGHFWCFLVHRWFSLKLCSLILRHAEIIDTRIKITDATWRNLNFV